MKNKRGDEWFPLFVDKWLFGSTRLELSHAERAIWVDLLALSKKDGGFIRANVGVPYPISQLAGLFAAEPELVKSAIDKALRFNKLQKLRDGTFFVCSTDKYTLSERHLRRIRHSNGEEFKPEYERMMPCPDKFRKMATKKGCVRKSRLIMAIAIGRPLLKEEEVHHIDNCDENDFIDNLMLFACHRDHLQYQHGYDIQPLLDGRKLDSGAKSAITAEITALCGAKAASSILVSSISSSSLQGGVVGNELTIIFEQFRKLYPGTKRGLEPEFDNFVKKHKNWKEIILLLLPALKKQIEHRDLLKQQKAFVPQWKNLKTWLNNDCWTEENGKIDIKEPQDYAKVAKEATEAYERMMQK